ncbi:rhomboid-like protein [Cellulomonas algicola]|uniref:rhomboid-like protein n=1 Tax=Cellulomonas algicola TaxID=2071633 RepID=UPI001C3FCD3E|nr:rhomboid-like protein [Cellulomonas algicola]
MTRDLARSVLRDVGGTVGRSDVALVYGGLVALGALVMVFLPDETVDAITAHASGNLDNMRARPVESLVLSGLVLPHPSNLVLVVSLVVAVAYTQRWLGRVATLLVIAAGQVVPSLVVGAVLTTGIARGWLSPALAGADDVGVSYVVACVTGVLVARVPRRWRWWYLALLVAVWVLPGVWLRTFTDVGHASALAVGLAVALVVSRGVEAAATPDGWRPRRADDRPHGWRRRRAGDRPHGDERHTPGTLDRDDGPGRPGAPDRP